MGIVSEILFWNWRVKSRPLATVLQTNQFLFFLDSSSGRYSLKLYLLLDIYLFQKITKAGLKLYNLQQWLEYTYNANILDFFKVFHKYYLDHSHNL
jgi:hypothetical protein